MIVNALSKQCKIGHGEIIPASLAKKCKIGHGELAPFYKQFIFLLGVQYSGIA